MSIVLFAMIGSMLHAGTTYWLVWLIYSIFRIVKVIYDSDK